MNIEEIVFINYFPNVVFPQIKKIFPSSYQYRNFSFSETEERFEKGIRWKLGGDLIGSAEIWLERQAFGTVVHFFVHGNFLDNLSKNQERRFISELRKAIKGTIISIKLIVEELEFNSKV